MSFIETPRFPVEVSQGGVGGPEYRTDVIEVDSGFEQRNAGWSQARNRYTIEFPLVETQKETLLAWFRSLKGKAHGFRIKDWSDYACTVSNGRLGTSANATGEAAYQLYKYYSAGSLEEYRKIVKPVSGSVSIYRGGVLQTAGASAGNYAIDTATGIVTFVRDAQVSVTSVTVGATTTISLSGALGLIAGQFVYLSGFTGADAADLNGLAHTISSAPGGSPDTLVLSTNTLGSVITVGAAIARKFAQASETLAWTGEFDVPVRFDVDYAALKEETPKVYFGQNFSLIEIRQ
jgi:uncharacterized protein (TIGR02217 family)